MSVIVVVEFCVVGCVGEWGGGGAGGGGGIQWALILFFEHGPIVYNLRWGCVE